MRLTGLQGASRTLLSPEWPAPSLGGDARPSLVAWPRRKGLLGALHPPSTNVFAHTCLGDELECQRARLGRAGPPDPCFRWETGLGVRFEADSSGRDPAQRIADLLVDLMWGPALAILGIAMCAEQETVGLNGQLWALYKNDAPSVKLPDPNPFKWQLTSCQQVGG
jgi:hypothetical protein